ncbi:MAG: peptidoglycan DD-metalloendopeptidase family protein [Anaerolineales bacterium]|nr:peptidoglycan DD-metalloendopeptidase family protein [Anaerolineales bacterium]
MTKRFIVPLLILLVFALVTPVSAQESTPTGGPVYIVQPGDTLWLIAQRFRVSLDDLMAANNLTDATIFVGDRLVIPGYEGLSGTLVTETVPYGGTLRSIVRQFRIEETFLRQLNHIVSPTELYAGVTLILLQQDERPAWSARTSLNQGETLLELAVRQDTDPWTVASINGLSGPWAALPGDVLYLPSGSAETFPTALPPAFSTAVVTPLPITQGGTAQIQVTVSENVTLTGTLVDMPLHFFPGGNGTFIALQGVHALLPPGLYPLRLEATTANQTVQTFEQMVLIVSGYYPEDPTLYVEPETIDPAVTEPENQLIIALTTPSNPERYWGDTFITPAFLYADVTAYTSTFGNRRTYVGQGTDLAVQGFHTGLDYAGGTGLQIVAPAAGVVVFAGPLTVRGNATIIDHGQGVYSGFWHQSEIQVQVSEHVEQGQVIGLVGGTGRVSGPHLHWEIWVNGIQVNPIDWLNEAFPR